MHVASRMRVSAPWPAIAKSKAEERVEGMFTTLTSSMKSLGSERKATLAVIAFSVAVGSVASVAKADVPNLFASGETLTAVALNANFEHLDGRLTAAELLLSEGVPLALQANNAATADGAGAGEFTVPGALTVAGNASVGGTLAIGLSRSTNCNSAATFTDCTCPAGHLAISGGAYAGGSRVLDESQNSDANGVGPVWRLGCKDASGTRVVCSAAHAICARLGP